MDGAFLDLTVPARDAAGQKTVEDDAALVGALQDIVGRSHVLTGPEATRRLLVRDAAGRDRGAPDTQALLRALLCHVLRQDYFVAKGSNCEEIDHEMWKLLDRRGAGYPAEHNAGHLCSAKPAMVDHFKALHPCNAFNPGIGRTTKCAHWMPRGQRGERSTLRCEG